MAITVKELGDWLTTLQDDDLVAIDDGGLVLQSVENPEVYIEIGGIPEEEETE